MRVVEHQNAHTKVIVMAATPYHHKSLRHRNVNYRSGWWSVSIQVAKNKSIFGTIAGDLSPNGMLTQMLKGLGRLSMVDGYVSKRAASAAQEEVR